MTGYLQKGEVRSPGGSEVKNLPAVPETWVLPLGLEDPLEKDMETHPSILAGKCPGHRSLVGYSPRGHRESDPTEQLALSLWTKGNTYTGRVMPREKMAL